jgi:hypothetical protein
MRFGEFFSRGPSKQELEAEQIKRDKEATESQEKGERYIAEFTEMSEIAASGSDEALKAALERTAPPRVFMGRQGNLYGSYGILYAATLTNNHGQLGARSGSSLVPILAGQLTDRFYQTSDSGLRELIARQVSQFRSTYDSIVPVVPKVEQMLFDYTRLTGIDLPHGLDVSKPSIEKSPLNQKTSNEPEVQGTPENQLPQPQRAVAETPPQSTTPEQAPVPKKNYIHEGIFNELPQDFVDSLQADWSLPATMSGKLTDGQRVESLITRATGYLQGENKRARIEAGRLLNYVRQDLDAWLLQIKDPGTADLMRDQIEEVWEEEGKQANQEWLIAKRSQ